MTKLKIGDSVEKLKDIPENAIFGGVVVDGELPEAGEAKVYAGGGRLKGPEWQMVDGKAYEIGELTKEQLENATSTKMVFHWEDIRRGEGQSQEQMRAQYVRFCIVRLLKEPYPYLADAKSKYHQW